MTQPTRLTAEALTDEQRDEMASAHFERFAAEKFLPPLVRHKFFTDSYEDPLTGHLWTAYREAYKQASRDCIAANAPALDRKYTQADMEMFAKACMGARDERLAHAPVADDVLRCDACGAKTADPWHTSDDTRRHLHQCDECHEAVNAPVAQPNSFSPERREPVVSAIEGAMAFGYQGTNPPTTADHWLQPFWSIGRKQAELEAALNAAPTRHPQPVGAGKAPERIWLIDYQDDHEGTLWCQDSVGDADIEYVRADLAAHAAVDVPWNRCKDQQDARAVIDFYARNPSAALFDWLHSPRRAAAAPVAQPAGAVPKRMSLHDDLAHSKAVMEGREPLMLRTTPTHSPELTEKDAWVRGEEDADGNELVTVRKDEWERLKGAEPAGTFACPICGKDTPHQHSGEEIVAHRNASKPGASTKALDDAFHDIRDWVTDDVVAQSYSAVAYRARLIALFAEHESRIDRASTHFPMPNLDGDWSPISETLIKRLRDPIPAQALIDMPERMAEALNVITEEAANAIESLAGQCREMEYLAECAANRDKAAAPTHVPENSGGDRGKKIHQRRDDERANMWHDVSKRIYDETINELRRIVFAAPSPEPATRADGAKS